MNSTPGVIEEVDIVAAMNHVRNHWVEHHWASDWLTNKSDNLLDNRIYWFWTRDVLEGSPRRRYPVGSLVLIFESDWDFAGYAHCQIIDSKLAGKGTHNRQRAFLYRETYPGWERLQRSACMGTVSYSMYKWVLSYWITVIRQWKSSLKSKQTASAVNQPRRIERISTPVVVFSFVEWWRRILKRMVKRSCPTKNCSRMSLSVYMICSTIIIESLTPELSNQVFFLAGQGICVNREFRSITDTLQKPPRIRSALRSPI